MKIEFGNNFKTKMINHYNRNENSSIVNRYNPTINSFIENINNIENTNNGPNTQSSASQHEDKCSHVISLIFNTTIIPKEPFRKFISDNEFSWCGQRQDAINRLCPEQIQIENNSLNLEYNKNYLIEQPSGEQNYPDKCLIRLSTNNTLDITMIECKKLTPTFNNTPPKMKKNCLYICGNRIFNGFLLTTPEWQEKYFRYITKYKDHVEEFKDDEFKAVLYKKVELNWRRGAGTLCYQERRDQNIPLITMCLSRYI